MFEIISAFYGPVGSTKDKVNVTEKVRERISSDKKGISMIVSPSSIGVEDKTPATPKELDVRYSINGEQRSETLRDGSTLNAKVPEAAPTSTTGKAASLYGTLWSQFISALFIFLAVFSIGLAFNLGSYLWNPIVWTVIALVVPYASFWIIPVILIIIRIFSSQDFIVPRGGRRR